MVSEFVFGKRLRHLRERKGWSLGRLATQLGCSKVYLSDVELGRRRPLGDERIQFVADELQLSVSETADLRDAAATSRGAL